MQALKEFDISELLGLHENALVAWDRDIGTLPGGAVYRVSKWDKDWRGDGSYWSTCHGGEHRYDGLGCIMAYEQRPGPGNSDHGRTLSRNILHLDSSDPLGVKWWMDPLIRP